MPKLKAEKKRKTKEFYDPYCFTNAVKKGDIFIVRPGENIPVDC